MKPSLKAVFFLNIYDRTIQQQETQNIMILALI